MQNGNNSADDINFAGIRRESATFFCHISRQLSDGSIAVAINGNIYNIYTNSLEHQTETNIVLTIQLKSHHCEGFSVVFDVHQHSEQHLLVRIIITIKRHHHSSTAAHVRVRYGDIVCSPFTMRMNGMNRFLK